MYWRKRREGRGRGGGKGEDGRIGGEVGRGGRGEDGRIGEGRRGGRGEDGRIGKRLCVFVMVCVRVSNGNSDD